VKIVKADSLIRAFFAWLGLFCLAFLNGALREGVIKRFLAEPWAHHLSALTAIGLFTIFVYLGWDKLRVFRRQQAVLVGLLWLALTVLTETFLLNRAMGKLTWREIAESYDVTRGHLWPLVLLWIAWLPLAMLEWRGKPT
jgi:hypothetical protein